MTVGQPLAYDDALRNRIGERLSGHERRAMDLDGRRHAAVALVLVDSVVGEDDEDEHNVRLAGRNAIPGAGAKGLDGRMAQVAGGAAVLLCRRGVRMREHAGQWALPGGRIDPGEDAVAAALRELDEELGVRLEPDAVLGLLDDYATRSGYVITPVVLWAGGRLELLPHPDEVLAVYRVGLHHLLRADSPWFVHIPESDRPVVQIPLSQSLVHAPTGAVLLQLRWLALEGRSDPVWQYEQPVFAWR